MGSPPLDILLAAPRGFCAGVDRAVQIVEQALARFGAPVYVRHEIVHNRFVVDGLRRRGAVFVESLDEIPDRARPVIFSAHGVPKSVPADAERLGLTWLDATCPLVTKVHRAAESHHAKGRHVLLIGHTGHPEVIGTMGQLPVGAVTLVTSVADAETVTPPAGVPLAYTTQTTLSVDDTREIVEVLKARFPEIAGPHRQDICYATTNRQEAVKAIAPRVEAMIVVGAPNSSNSQRLREVAEREGCRAVLLASAADIDWPSFEGVNRLGITAGASAPEVLVEEMIAAFAARREVRVETVVTAEETVVFNLPKGLRDDAADAEA
ncbi:MAG: 4-hydroxy-3-methylbut-2-enyl diphosphate reductase [Phyllobacteriaceae bacterium]|nr:4-hydroxy-3-methylbut-2-enyl diphosphate reductase [Phyllobacteriaceae bacterium]